MRLCSNIFCFLWTQRLKVAWNKSISVSPRDDWFKILREVSCLAWTKYKDRLLVIKSALSGETLPLRSVWI